MLLSPDHVHWNISTILPLPEIGELRQWTIAHLRVVARGTQDYKTREPYSWPAWT